MLRITVVHDAQGATFKMEGKLSHEWVTEAEKAWTVFSSTPQRERVVVDLCGVSFVDDPGRELLSRMHSSGAKLIGTGPMTGALIKEICGEDRPPDHRWIRSVLSLFFLLLVGIESGNTNLFNHLQTLSSRVVASRSLEPIAPVFRAMRYRSAPGNKHYAITFQKGL